MICNQPAKRTNQLDRQAGVEAVNSAAVGIATVALLFRSLNPTPMTFHAYKDYRLSVLIKRLPFYQVINSSKCRTFAGKNTEIERRTETLEPACSHVRLWHAQLR